MPENVPRSSWMSLLGGRNVVGARPPRPTRFALASAIMLLLTSSCDRRLVDIEPLAAGRALSRVEEVELSRVAEAAFRDARARLAGLPPRITLIVRFGKDVLPETGETGAAGYPGNIALTLDPDRDVVATIRDHVRSCLLHELHHLARQSQVPNRRRVLDRVVSEGLATAFERDVTGSTPPWGDTSSKADVEAWTREVLASGDSPDVERWFPGPPERRFAGHRVGVFLVDRASSATHSSAAQMASTPVDEVVRASDAH